MKTLLYVLIGFCFMISCSPSGKSSVVKNNIAVDNGFGYTKENPIKVAGLSNGGPSSEQFYLSSLRGPNGEKVEFKRRGSCCPFSTPNGIGGYGMLDIYEVAWKGLDKPVVLYLNMYDKPTEIKAPAGMMIIQF